MDFYWEMATLIDIMLIGHYFEMKSECILSNTRSIMFLKVVGMLLVMYNLCISLKI